MSDPDPSMLKGTLLYEEYRAERDEILRHKWFESERAGHDVGFEKALLSWILNHRAHWRQSRHGLRATSSMKSGTGV